MNNMRPIQPGEVLRKEYLEPFAMSASELAKKIGVPANRVSKIVNGSRAITADTAYRLAAAFSTTPQFWMNLQQAYDLAVCPARHAEGHWRRWLHLARFADHPGDLSRRYRSRRPRSARVCVCDAQARWHRTHGSGSGRRHTRDGR